MINYRLVLPAMRYNWIVLIFMPVITLNYVLVSKNIGSYYRAIYISNKQQEQEELSTFILHSYFHECSMTSKCNYVVEDKKNGVKTYKSRSEVPAEEDLLGIWMKMQRQYSYRVFTEELNWYNASNKCRLHGGGLASITSKEEEEKIKEKLFGFSSNTIFFFGLNDIEEEGKYVWSDGSEYNYTNWVSGEPDNLGNEDCMVVKPALKWYDSSCEAKCYFICMNFVI